MRRDIGWSIVGSKTKVPLYINTKYNPSDDPRGTPPFEEPGPARPGPDPWSHRAPTPARSPSLWPWAGLVDVGLEGGVQWLWAAHPEHEALWFACWKALGGLP